jgi:hypothetical protein
LWKSLRRSGGQQARDPGRRPTVTACRGPDAARFKLLGDGCQGRVTCPLDLGYHRPRRGIGLTHLFCSGRTGAGLALDFGCSRHHAMLAPAPSTVGVWTQGVGIQTLSAARLLGLLPKSIHAMTPPAGGSFCIASRTGFWTRGGPAGLVPG